MSKKRKTILNILLKSMLAATESHWLVKGISTFVAELADNWDELQDEVLEIAQEDIYVEIRKHAHQLQINGNIKQQLAELNKELPSISRSVQIDLGQLLENIIEAFEQINVIYDKVNKIYSTTIGELISLDVFEDQYWDDFINEKSFENLNTALGNEGQVHLKNTLVGRDTELEEFDSFLNDKYKTVLYHPGVPGSGKSRLLIAYARRAEACGWPVFFVPFHANVDIINWLKILYSNNEKKLAGVEGVLLLWDDWQGNHEDTFKKFLTLHKNHSLYRFKIKRIITTWPHFQTFIDREIGGESYYAINQLTMLQKNDIEALLSNILPQNNEYSKTNHIEELKAQAKGNPLELLLGLDLIFCGKDFDSFPKESNIVTARYNRLINQIDQNNLETFRRLAIIRSASLQQINGEKIEDSIPSFTKELKILTQQGYIRFDGKIKCFEIHLDSLRQYIFYNSLTSKESDPLWLADPIQNIVESIKPFLPAWLPNIWLLGVSTLNKNNEKVLLEELKDSLLKFIGEKLQ